MWARQDEFASFQDCLFCSRKQARHPRIGERAIEYPWVYKRISDLQGCHVLDVGAKEGLPITDLLLERNNTVYAIDPHIPNSFKRGQLTVIKGDIRSTSFDQDFFDAVIVVSTLEHIGVPGRYNITVAEDNGDFRAMQEIRRILKPGGRVLITVPYGTGKSLPLNRLYDAKRIKQLFEEFDLVECEYFKYMPRYGLWLEVPEDVASSTNWDVEPWYALACFCALPKVGKK